jgi:hypothetical protein
MKVRICKKGRFIMDWFFSKITDYWDNKSKNSIYEYAKEIRKYDSKEQEQIRFKIIEAIVKHFGALNDKQLAMVATVIVDDIYKSLNSIPVFMEEIITYLDASAGTFFELLKRKNFVVHYLTNNAYSDLQRPIDIYRDCFIAANIRYICPHEIAVSLMENDGITRSDYQKNIDRYIDEAKLVGDMVIDKCHENMDSYFNLQIDGDEEKFQKSIDMIGREGIITVFRSDSPLESTKYKVFYPSDFES